jgi:ER-Golgi trafficking TRAPP I complex 85 kDa subunit
VTLDELQLWTSQQGDSDVSNLSKLVGQISSADGADRYSKSYRRGATRTPQPAAAAGECSASSPAAWNSTGPSQWSAKHAADSREAALSPERLASEQSLLLEQLESGEREDTLTPWYARYRNAYLEQAGVREFEYFQRPVVCMLMVASHSGADAVSLFRHLYDPKKPPAVVRALGLDANMCIYHVLVHDCSREVDSGGATESGRSVLENQTKQMKSLLGANVSHLLQVNSQSVLQDTPALRDPRASSTAPPPRTLLSDSDLKRLESVVSDVALSAVVPHLEQRMKCLHEQLASSKKSFSFRSWFGRGRSPASGKDSSDGSGSSGRNSSSSSSSSSPPSSSSSSSPSSSSSVGDTGAAASLQESSTTLAARRLGDVLVMLRQYDAAATHYKSAGSDFKADKRYGHQAAAAEMMALCSFLSDPLRSKEADQDLERAYNAYRRAGAPQCCLVRVAFFLYAIMCARRNYANAAVFLTASAEQECNRLRAALFQEQVGGVSLSLVSS